MGKKGSRESVLSVSLFDVISTFVGYLMPNTLVE